MVIKDVDEYSDKCLEFGNKRRCKQAIKTFTGTILSDFVCDELVYEE